MITELWLSETEVLLKLLGSIREKTLFTMNAVKAVILRQGFNGTEDHVSP